MKLSGTLNAYLDTNNELNVTQFADAITSGDTRKALGALMLSGFNLGILKELISLGTATISVESAEVDKNEIIRKAVEVMRAKRGEILAEAQAKATAIDAKIQNLLAIEYTPPIENVGAAPADDDGITDVEVNPL